MNKIIPKTTMPHLTSNDAAAPNITKATPPVKERKPIIIVIVFNQTGQSCCLNLLMLNVC